jgi:hypothetical protein
MKSSVPSGIQRTQTKTKWHWASSFPHINQRALVVELVHSLTFWERVDVFIIQGPYL